MMTRIIGLSLFSVGMVGCANTPIKSAQQQLTELRQHLQQSPSVQSSLSQIAAQPLPTKKKIFHINEKLPVYRFEQGAVYVLKLELPTYQAPYQIVLTGTGNIARDGNLLMFAPVVYLLDAQHQVVRHISSQDLVRRGTGSLERTVFINPKNAQERYLVIAGELGDVSYDRTVASINNGSTYVAGVGGVSWSTGTESTNKVFYAPIGTVSIQTITP